MRSKANSDSATSETSILPVAQDLKENRPARYASALRFEASSGNRISTIITRYDASARQANGARLHDRLI